MEGAESAGECEKAQEEELLGGCLCRKLDSPKEPIYVNRTRSKKRVLASGSVRSLWFQVKRELVALTIITRPDMAPTTVT